MTEHVCRYVVAMCGDLNRGERLNFAVLVWDMALGVEGPVAVRVIEDWSRIKATFWAHFQGDGADTMVSILMQAMKGMRTLADFRRIEEKMGPYTPFEFTEERTSLCAPVPPRRPPMTWLTTSSKRRTRRNEGIGDW